jgi:hypothetical protein
VSGYAVVSYANLIDASSTDVSLAFATADPDHPISNLKRRGLGDYLQLSAELEDMTLNVDFGSVKTFNLIAAMGLGMGPVDGSGSILLSYSTSVDGISWGSSTSVSVTDFAPIYLPGTIFAVVPAGITTRYLRVDLTYSAAEPKRFARLWVDNALLLENVVEDSPDFSFRDAGELSETDGQQYVEFRKSRTKVVPLSLRGLSTLQAWGFSNGDDEALAVPSINGMQFAAGLTGEVIVLPIAITDTPATDTLWQRRTGVYGHIVSPYQITRDINAESWRTSFTVQEER